MKEPCDCDVISVRNTAGAGLSSSRVVDSRSANLHKQHSTGVDVLTQIAAGQKALDGVARIITRNYLERCVTDAIASGDPLIYDELMRVIDRRR